MTIFGNLVRQALAASARPTRARRRKSPVTINHCSRPCSGDFLWLAVKRQNTDKATTYVFLKRQNGAVQQDSKKVSHSPAFTARPPAGPDR